LTNRQFLLSCPCNFHATALQGGSQSFALPQAVPNPTSRSTMVLSFILIQNRQGKTRLAKWYAPYTDEEKVRLKGEVCSIQFPSTTHPDHSQVHRLIAPRDQKYQSNFVEFRSAPSSSTHANSPLVRQNLSSTKIVYRRYAGLFFCVCVDANDNELAYLEAIHFFVEVLDQFFGNVCELDLVCYFGRGIPSRGD
jgi:AP-2 complex subunit sigma-1